MEDIAMVQRLFALVGIMFIKVNIWHRRGKNW